MANSIFEGLPEMKIKLTLIEEALGMMPSDPRIHDEYIASRAPDAESIEEEIASMGAEAVIEKGKTIFPKMEDGTPFVWDYQIRGMLKDSIGMLRRVSGSKCAGLKNYKKVVDGLIFVKERKIPFTMSGPLGDCQRPLRAETPQGQRVAIAHSETVPAGSSLTFTIQMLDDGVKPVIRECMDYGIFRGLAQWRNSGKGKFTWEEVE